MTIKKIKLKNEIRWEASIRPKNHGKRRLRRRFRKKIDAQQFLHSIQEREEQTLGSYSKKGVLDIEETTFNKEADYWLEKKGPYFTVGYFRSIKPALKRIRRLYGHHPISRFTPALLFDFRILLKKEGLTAATQNRYADLISRIINFSYRQKRINENPCLGYDKVREGKKEMKFWTEPDARDFLDFANSKYPYSSNKRWMYCLYLLALETGMRAAELWGVKVSDIPKTGNTMAVARQYIGGGIFTPTKGKDFRQVPLSDALRDEMYGLLKRQKEVSDNRTLFTTRVGTPINHRNFTKRVFKQDVMESGLRQIRFHDLRHTALTLMVKRGVPLPVAQRVAGHTDIKVTMRYVHVIGKDIDDMGRQFSLASRKKSVEKHLHIVAQK